MVGSRPGGRTARLGRPCPAPRARPMRRHPRPKPRTSNAMPDPIPQAEPVDLDALDAFLMSDHAPEDSMGLSDLDGFLTGIVVGPELILPSEWLPVVWGGEEPAFESIEEARAILGIIMGRYNEIVRAIDAAPDDLDPVFW